MRPMNINVTDIGYESLNVLVLLFTKNSAPNNAGLNRTKKSFTKPAEIII